MAFNYGTLIGYVEAMLYHGQCGNVLEYSTFIESFSVSFCVCAACKVEELVLKAHLGLRGDWLNLSTFQPVVKF